ncbi:MAG TPA: dihydrolipoyl dehydrogenase [Rhodopila sp.]|nr:dihydrolipoyl dehydrogenase [Rhodopila sp.]
MADLTTKVLIVGGGPGGYVCAIRAAQLGMDVVLVEENAVGGTCLNVGCIPSKALIHAAEAFHQAHEQARGDQFGIRVASPTLDFVQTLAWKDRVVSQLTGGVGALLKHAGVRVIVGRAMLLDGKTCQVDGQTIRAEHLVLATGSQAVALPALPFGGRVISSTEAMAEPAVPDRLVVVGAGYIGLELGTAFAKLGAQVTVVEAAPRILPQYDADLTVPVARRLTALGIDAMTGTRAGGLSAAGDALLAADPNGNEHALRADRILVAVGRRPRTEGFGLERLDLTMQGPYVAIDARCATSMRNVWAIGDLTGEPLLAHRAMAQGEMVAEIIGGQRRSFDKVVASVCFTDPEIVAVGLSPEAARSAGYDVTAAQVPFAANGRALTMGSPDGFVRVVARADNRLLLGIQAVGHGISEFAAGFALALEMGARLEDVAGTIHAHPTQGEALQEAALKALGRAIHVT